VAAAHAMMNMFQHHLSPFLRHFAWDFHLQILLLILQAPVAARNMMD
jgi:hypothetical protein